LQNRRRRFCKRLNGETPLKTGAANMVTLRGWVGLWLVGVLVAAGLARGAENDFFDRAVVIQGLSAQVAGNNYGCSADEAEPAHYPGCPAANSVWWTWTPEASGRQ
jgi:hypothetical protein